MYQQPYHTRADSKPFSYFRTNSNSRANSRASSRDNVGNGLESPQILRKIMVGHQSGSLADSMSIGTADSRPLSPSGKCAMMQVTSS